MPETPRRSIRTAMVFAAGIGERGRILTESLPAPLIEVGGKPVIDHLFDRFAAHGVERAVVSLHHHRAILAAHLARLTAPPAIETRITAEPLEAGAALLDALPQLSGDAVLVAAADMFWLDGLLPTLDRLARAWDPRTMDAVLLLQATVTARGYDGLGDYFIDPAGRARRRIGHEVATHLYAGVAIVAPGLLRDPPAGSFGLTAIFDRAEAQGRLCALSHDGLWFRLADQHDVVHAEIELGFRPTPAAEAEKLRY